MAAKLIENFCEESSASILAFSGDTRLCYVSTVRRLGVPASAVAEM
jgi:hypothetical protein